MNFEELVIRLATTDPEYKAAIIEIVKMSYEGAFRTSVDLQDALNRVHEKAYVEQCQIQRNHGYEGSVA